jgi:hypothetical protein
MRRSAAGEPTVGVRWPASSNTPSKLPSHPSTTPDPLTAADSLVQASAEREALEQLTDQELLRKAAREVAIAVYVVANAMIYKAEVMATKPAEAGFLAQALANASRLPPLRLGHELEVRARAAANSKEGRHPPRSLAR